jgi:GGDEF domain-containing protein
VVEGEPEELAEYTKRVAPLIERISEESSAEDILLAVTTALWSLDEHNRRTRKFIDMRSFELKSALRTMTETISVLTESRSESVERLTLVEGKMEKASAIQDIRSLRSSLQDCLDVIKEENARLRAESEARLHVLEEKVQSALASTASLNRAASSMDVITGLESHAAAEHQIAERITEGRPCVVALFVVSRLAFVNRHFGRKIGDQVLTQIARHISNSLPPNSMLFRWSGPALAAVVDIQPNLEEVNRKLARIASAHLSKNVDDGGRSLLVPITVALWTQRAGAGSVEAGVFKAMDNFVAANASEEAPTSLTR